MVQQLKEVLRSVEKPAVVQLQLRKPEVVQLQLAKAAQMLGVVVASVYRVDAPLLCGWGAALPLPWEPRQSTWPPPPTKRHA